MQTKMCLRNFRELSRSPRLDPADSGQDIASLLLEWYLIFWRLKLRIFGMCLIK